MVSDNSTVGSIFDIMNDCNSHSHGRYHALVCWLWDAQIYLPNQQFKEEIFTISLSDLVCTNFQVKSINSLYTPSSSPKNASIQVESRGISATCTGSYAWSGLGGGSGNVVASVSGNAIHLQMDVASSPLSELAKHSSSRNNNSTKASLSFPTLVSVSACQPSFNVHDVQFTGSASARIIGLFSKPISNKLTTVLNENFCILVQKNGEKAVNGALNSAGEYIGGLILQSDYLYEQDDSTSATLTDSLMNGANNEITMHRNLESNDAVTWDGDMPFLKRILLRFNNFIGGHIDEGIILKTFQSIETTTCEDCGFFFKGLNGMVNSLTKGTGSVDFIVPETIFTFDSYRTFNIPSYGNVTVGVNQIQISGLNNLTNLSLLQPSGLNSVSSSIASDAGFESKLVIDVKVTPTNGGTFQGDTLNESFELMLNMSNVSLAADSIIIFDREVLEKLTVGSVISGSYTTFDSHRNILNCVLEALSSIIFTDTKGRLTLDKISISASNTKETFLESSLEDDVDKMINNILQLIVQEYGPTVTESLAALIQSPARVLANEALSKFMRDYNALPLHCVNTEVPHNAVQRPFRFDENVYLWMFDNLFDGGLMIDAANSFITCVTNMLAMNTKLLSFPFGDMIVDLRNLTVANYGSIYELDLLRPEIDHYHIKNKLGWGKDTSLSFGIDVSNSHHDHVGAMNVELNMSSFELNAGAEMMYDMNYLPNLEVTDLLANPQCYATPITNFGFYDFNMMIDSLELSMDISLDSGSNGQTKFFSYTTDDAAKLAKTMTAMMSDGATKIQNTLEILTLVELNGASTVCKTPMNPNRSYSSKHPDETAAGIWTILIVLTFAAVNSWLFMKGPKNDEYHAIPTSEDQANLTEPLLNSNRDMNSSEDGMDEVMEVESPHSHKLPLSSSTSLMYHQSISNTLRFGFPIVLVLTIILLLSSNLSVGASVDLEVSKMNGQSFTSLINIYQFSLSSTLREMWRAGVYLLMLLIWFCSGVWPYVKLILMLMCWMTSTRRLPPIRRERILYLLDSLGKWSLIDTYVMVLFLVAFRYSIELAGTVALDVYVTPKFGFYSFLLATVMSLVSGHAILFVHRRSTLPIIPVYSGRYESLSRHVFEDKRGRGLLKMTKSFRRAVIITILLTFALLITGANLQSFHFSFNGVAGAALGDARIRNFSLISIGETIPQSVQNSSSFGIHFIQGTYFFFALVMPLVCLVSLLILFVVPMKMQRQQQFFILAEVTNAWSGVEVFVIAIMASLAETGQFSSSMVQEQCNLLEQVLSGFSTDELHHCFSVKTTISSSSTVLIGGVILNSLLVSTMHKLCHHAIWERIEREDRPDAPTDESNTLRDCLLAHTFVSKVRNTKIGYIIFEEISFGPHGEFDIDFENIVEDEEPGHTGFWNEWQKMVSVI